MEDERIQALTQHIKAEEQEQEEVEADELSTSSYDEKIIEWGKREYLVVTDEEADELWEEDLDNYIDECILSELPEQYKCYFDEEKWKDDARLDGRAHSLSRYDESEYEEEVNNTTYYIYRQN